MWSEKTDAGGELEREDSEGTAEASKRESGHAERGSRPTLRMRPLPLDPAQLNPQEIRILLLADGGITFGNEHYGLSLFIEVFDAYNPFVRFNVTTANRNAFDDTADYPGFSFEKDFNPKRFHEVWLFGSEPDLKKKLPEKELEILAKFMNDGGGVFATGDHEALGAALCGEVPRVRRMRKWFFADPLPNGQPRSTPRDNEFRHDSLNRGDNYEYEYLDQIDDAPQLIFPKMFNPTCCLKGSPHPVLAYGLEAIRFLPDHVHEGECYVPDDLDTCFQFGAYKGEDFPAGPGTGSKRVGPEVIAWAQIPDPHITRNYLQCLPTGQVPSFGIIGAYDGRQADVGRVVVDASFHHFVNFNLYGFATSEDRASKDKGQHAYEQIKAYFGNIALWLARPQTHRKVFNRVLAVSLRTYPLIEELLTLRDRINSESLRFRDYYNLGLMARSTVGSLTSSALAREWAFDLFQDLLAQSHGDFFQKLLRGGLLDVADLLFGVNVEAVIDTLLGMLTVNVTRLLGDTRQAAFEVSDQTLNGMFAAGVADAASLFFKSFDQYAAGLNKLTRDFNNQLGRRTDMPKNPFSGGWGFQNDRPKEEPDTRFDVEDTNDQDRATIFHETPPKGTSEGHTTGEVLSFLRQIPDSKMAIHYYNARKVSQQGEITTIKGRYHVIPDIEAAKRSERFPPTDDSDPDWTANRPA